MVALSKREIANNISYLGDNKINIPRKIKNSIEPNPTL